MRESTQQYFNFGHVRFLQLNNRFDMFAGDALRYLVLNSHGGVYLDMDVECFQPTNGFLRGYDLVLNVELDDNVTVTNAIMASAPGIPFWERVIQKLQVGHSHLHGLTSNSCKLTHTYTFILLSLTCTVSFATNTWHSPHKSRDDAWAHALN